MQIERLHSTFAIITKRNIWYLQFTFKQPWILPKIDRNYLDGTITLIGWLFVYFGWDNNYKKFKKIKKDLSQKDKLNHEK